MSGRSGSRSTLERAEWVPVNWQTDSPGGIAYLETVRSITGTGTWPTDHPDVLLSDQRRMHAAFALALRGLGLKADVTPAGAP
ncbi:MAG: hypothetical protein EBT22_11295 [Chloroflexi bacterium]|nr:hypothetical protein [Chloroflexota bacterium]